MTSPSQSISPAIAALPPRIYRRGKASVSKLPVNLFAAVMGFSGLALAWRFAHSSLGAPAFIGEALGAFAVFVFVLLALAYLTKLAKHPVAVHAEFHHPGAGYFFGTIAISILLLSAVIAPYSAVAAQVTWTVGVLATFALGYTAVALLLKGRIDAAEAVPAWIIPCVATLDIPVTGAHMPMAWALEVNLLAGAIGSVMALVLFAMIISRLVHHQPLAPAMTPSLMILMAPFAVGFLAYVNITDGIDRFAALLLYFALFMFAVLAPKIFGSGIPFSAGWWAVGFPMAALANGALKYAEFRATGPLWTVAVLLLSAVSLALAALTVQTARTAINGKLFT